MSNDLISRKLVYADKISGYIKAEINPYGKPFEGTAYELGLKIMKYIDNMNAAYDVDKIVGQLERDKFIEQEIILTDVHQGYNAGLAKAVEIVKAGRIEELTEVTGI